MPLPLREKKLGLLLSTAPEAANFHHGLRLAEAALNAGLKVYLYCIDEAVLGLRDARLQSLKSRGLVLYACAYAAQRRNLPLDNLATPAGLGMVTDLMTSTDRFLSFN